MTDGKPRHCWLRLRTHDWEATGWPGQSQCTECGKYRHDFHKLPI